MKTLLSIIIILASFFTKAHSQYSIIGETYPVLPVGGIADNATIGFGFNLSGKYELNDDMSVGGRVGFMRLGCKDITILDDKVTPQGSHMIMPWTAFYEYNLPKIKRKFLPYAGVDLGFYYINAKAESSGTIFYDAADTKFGFAPYGGMSYGIIRDKLELNMTLKYHFILKSDKLPTDKMSMLFSLNFGAIYKIDL